MSHALVVNLQRPWRRVPQVAKNKICPWGRKWMEGSGVTGPQDVCPEGHVLGVCLSWDPQLRAPAPEARP